MIPPVQTQRFPLPPVDRREILRYAGAKTETPELAALLDACLAEALPVISGNVCWTHIPVCQKKGCLDLTFVLTSSESLKRNLRNCHEAVIFGATLGLGLDRLISRYSCISPSKALMFQAIGAERIEGLCDVFCEAVRCNAADSGLRTAPRFSPGYGDFPLDVQQDIFRLLDCSRKIGLTLNESLIMSPSKSVTAIIGLGLCPDSHPVHGCSHCSKTDCTYRRMP